MGTFRTVGLPPALRQHLAVAEEHQGMDLQPLAGKIIQKFADCSRGQALAFWGSALETFCFRHLAHPLLRHFPRLFAKQGETPPNPLLGLIFRGFLP